MNKKIYPKRCIHENDMETDAKGMLLRMPLKGHATAEPASGQGAKGLAHG